MKKPNNTKTEIKNPWDPIVKAFHDLIEKGAALENIRVLCSARNQTILRYIFEAEARSAIRASGLEGKGLASIMFMGVAFQDYPYNTEILVFRKEACYYDSFVIKIPVSFNETPWI